MIHKKTIFILLGSLIFIILIILMFVYLFSSNNYIPHLINLPLQTSSSFSDISSLLKNNIRTTITVSDKKQEIDLFLLPSDYSFFLTQQDILFKNNDNTRINKFSKNFYDFEYSNTIKIISDKKKISFAQYNMAKTAEENFILCDKDTCNENSLELKQFKFMLAEDPYDKISGGIGLSPISFIRNEAVNFFNELYEKNYINNKVWYINYDKKNDKRNLIIGKMPYEVDDKFDKNDYIFFDVKDKGLEFEMLNIIIGDDNNDDNQENIIKEKNFVLTPDSSLIYGPYEYYKKIKSIFFSKYFTERKCIENIYESSTLVEYLYLTCNNDISLNDFPPLTIVINKNFKLELTSEDLFTKNNENLFFLFITNREERYSGKWYVGEPFLKKYLPVYDQGKEKIGFYKVIIKYKTSYRIIATVGFIFFIICMGVLVYLGLYLYRKYKNKKIRKAALEMRIEEISSKLVEKNAGNNDKNNI